MFEANILKIRSNEESNRSHSREKWVSLPMYHRRHVEYKLHLIKDKEFINTLKELTFLGVSVFLFFFFTMGLIRFLLGGTYHINYDKG